MRRALEELRSISEELTAWEYDVAQVILTIPHGRLATYGCIARITGSLRPEYSSDASRAVGNLRRKLYRLLGYDTKIPLHRVATQGDLYSKKDSEETRGYNAPLRDREGTLRQDNPWWCGEGIVNSNP